MGPLMWQDSAYQVFVLYPGQEEPVWCDTVNEALTYIVAENIGRGLPPFTYLQTVEIQDDEAEGDDQFPEE